MENRDKKNNTELIISYFKKYKKLIILSVVFMIFYSITNPLQLWILKPFIDKMFVKDALIEVKLPSAVFEKMKSASEYLPDNLVKNDFTERTANFLKSVIIINQKKMFMFVSVYIIFIAAFKGLFKFLHNYILLYITGMVVKNLRVKLYNKLLHLPFSFYSQRKAGDILSRFTNDVTILQGTLSNLIIQTIEKPAEIFFLTVFVFLISWQLSIVAFLIVPVVGILIYWLGRLIRKYIIRIQLKISDITQHLQESIQGIKIIKSFTAEKLMLEKFDDDNDIHFRQNLKSWKLQVLSSPVIELFTMFGVIGVLWASLYLTSSQNLTSGTIVTFIAALMTMYKPIKELTQLNVNYHQIKVVLGRINEILNIEEDIREISEPIEFKGLEKIITFNNVNFKYSEDKEILKNISFSVNEGKTVALVGPSGAGKSTLVNLLPRFYDVSSGIISFDRVNIKNYSLSSLRRHIAIVEQEIFLFNDSIKNNICFPDKECDMEKAIECSKLANAYDFIQNLPQGYDTVVGDRGQTLSVGQKQRLAIARAVYKPASILILDEATSALDSESEKLVQNAIDNLLKKYTTFVIAHRLSTIKNADLILVLKDKTIVEQGTHTQLLNKNAHYAQFYNTQFNK